MGWGACQVCKENYLISFLDLKKINDSFESEISKAINKVLESGWYVLGKEIASFEKE